MSDLPKDARFDVYRTVTESIIAAIEAGAGEFVMPWHARGAAIARPENAHTHMAYHGINVIALWAQAYGRGFESGYWGSYKQWQQEGAQVRRGEHGATVVFYKQFDNDDRKSNDTEARQQPRLFARASRVFNADQVAGWQPPIPPPASDPVEVLASVAEFVRISGATVSHGHSHACYNVPLDKIDMPAPERFTGSPTSTPSQAYHATLLHELVHWTGAAHRLDRELGRMTRSELAAEELIAEIGAAFLCADLGVANAPRPDHAAYVASWLQLLRDDTRAIFTASRAASRAADYLHELSARSQM